MFICKKKCERENVIKKIWFFLINISKVAWEGDITLNCGKTRKTFLEINFYSNLMFIVIKMCCYFYGWFRFSFLCINRYIFIYVLLYTWNFILFMNTFKTESLKFFFRVECIYLFFFPKNNTLNTKI